MYSIQRYCQDILKHIKGDKRFVRAIFVDKWMQVAPFKFIWSSVFSLSCCGRFKSMKLAITNTSKGTNRIRFSTRPGTLELCQAVWRGWLLVAKSFSFMCPCARWGRLGRCLVCVRAWGFKWIWKSCRWAHPLPWLSRSRYSLMTALAGLWLLTAAASVIGRGDGLGGSIGGGSVGFLLFHSMLFIYLIQRNLFYLGAGAWTRL